ncbi:hypothetical protein [Nitratireductor rhodophyticola]|uniref:hypothetical protein n=1 Tax=Nitratireductor rhodophyticola TaxID=2854036 RepID=UPI000A4AEA3B|nr:hypothetical protein [Nitratireductor rhodophyticola]MEC9245528.1 hypothetical protein [Pseudomonadota bacterium]
MLNEEAKALSDGLAHSHEITDYDFWRALKSIEDELYWLERNRRPIPIDLIYVRAIVRTARQKRLFIACDPAPFDAF